MHSIVMQCGCHLYLVPCKFHLFNSAWHSHKPCYLAGAKGLCCHSLNCVCHAATAVSIFPHHGYSAAASLQGWCMCVALYGSCNACLQFIGKLLTVHAHAMDITPLCYCDTWYMRMQFFNLDNNQLTGTIPASWSKQGLMRSLGLNNNTGLT